MNDNSILNSVSSSLRDSAYTTTLNLDFDNFLSKESKEKIISKLLEDEDELMPILKKYLVGYLDKIMDNPDSIIKELIKEKDTEIKDLKDRVEYLENLVKGLTNPYISPFNPSTPIGPNPYAPPIIWNYADKTDNINNSINAYNSTYTTTV